MDAVLRSMRPKTEAKRQVNYIVSRRNEHKFCVTNYESDTEDDTAAVEYRRDHKQSNQHTVVDIVTALYISSFELFVKLDSMR